jgi:hypothetical protein
MPKCAEVSSAPQRIAKDLLEEQAIIAIMWIGTLSCELIGLFQFCPICV